MKMTAENSLEDYWEDASVSWGCRGLTQQSAQRESTIDNKPSCIQDFHITTSAFRPRNFPPPIALCTTLSIKTGGRFVLKEMASPPTHGLRAEREQGRLFLHLIEPTQLDEDEEDENNENYDNVCNLEDTAVCTDLHQQEQQDGYKALAIEDINVSITSHEKAKYDTSQGMPQELASVFEETEGKPEKHAHAGEARTKECNDGNKDVKSSSSSEKHAMEHIETRDNSIGACMMPSIAHANEIEIKNGGGGAYMGALGIGQQHQRASLRSKEGNNDIAASLSPCSSSKQVLPHQSFSPALGLAVS